MSTADGIQWAEELERHARWMRRLAGALLHDEGAAEDLVQEAWLAAMTRPPAEGRIRPWLREVARNFARMRLRGDARRAQRERESRPPAAPEEPDVHVQRLEAEQRLSRELAALEEPFRSVLMLRYYEDLEPAEIARRLGLPGGTVRWRLMRAHALLRERLDRAHGGDRRAWALALVPLARLDGAAGAGAAATAVVLPGVVLMNVLKLSAAAAAVIVLAFGLSMSGLLPESLSLARRERPLEVGFRALELAPGDTPAPARDAQPASEAERVALVAGGAPEPAAAAATGTAAIDARLFGRGRALTDARLVVVHAGERREALSAGSDGLAACSFPLAEPRALVRIEIYAFGYASEERSAVCEQGGTTHLGRIELVPGGAVSGRIVDERGVGLADCRVTLGSVEDPFNRLQAARLLPARDGIPTCTSDGEGRFRLLGVAAGMTRLWAHGSGRKADYTPPFEVRAGQESTGVELVLEPLAPTNLLRGIVLDPEGNPVPRAEIAYRHAMDGGDSVRSGESRADADGRFEFRLPEDARSWLRATDPAGRWSAATLSDVANGERELVLQLREAREVELVVRDGTRAPLESFAVELRGVDDSADLEWMRSTARSVRPSSWPSSRRGSAAWRAASTRAAAPASRCPRSPSSCASSRRGTESSSSVRSIPRASRLLECTLEPVPGLAGVVLRGGAPVPGVRVELRTEVEDGTTVIADGYRVRIHPDVRDEARTDPEGRFLLTPRVPGSYFVRAEPGDGAPAEVGPLALVLRLLFRCEEVAISHHLVGSAIREAHLAALRHTLPGLGVRVLLDLEEVARFADVPPETLKDAAAHPCQLEPPEVRERLTDEQRQLVERLCMHWTRARLRALGGGFSGSLLLLAEGWKGEARTEPMVLKIDAFRQMRKELAGYSLVKDFLGKHVPTFAHPVSVGDWLGVGMELAAREGTPETLQDTFERAEDEEQARHFFRRLDKTLEILVGKLLRNTRELEWVVPYRDFGLHTEQQQLWLRENAGWIQGYLAEAGLPAPSIGPDELVTVFALITGNHNGLESEVCLAHGDLNYANVLCDRGDDIWLVDWTHCAKMPVELDFAKIENDAKFVMKSALQLEDLPRLRKLEEFLVQTRALPGLDELPSGLSFVKWDLRLRKLYGTVRRIRAACFALKAGDDWTVYRIALLRYAVHTLSFDARRGRGECEVVQLASALHSASELVYDLFSDPFHMQIRAERPDEYPLRQQLTVDEAPWSRECAHYDPPYYVAPAVLAGHGQGWADPEDFASLAELAARVAEHRDREGRPLNPAGRTGVAGRGLLGLWGANVAVAAVLVRPADGRRALEVALGQRSGQPRLELPKGFVLPGEDPTAGIVRILASETGVRSTEPGEVVLEESTFDARQTDHAWVETRVQLFFDAREGLPDLLAAGGDFETVQWWPLDAATINRVPSEQAAFLRASIECLAATERIESAVARCLLVSTG